MNFPLRHFISRSGILCLFAALIFISGGCARKRELPAGENAPRVISLAPNVTEIICALGAEKMLVGRTSACDYPPGIVKNIPVIGGFGAPSLEALVNLRPTIVIDVDLEDESVAGMIKKIGIKHVRVPCARIDDVPGAIKIIGGMVGADSRADELANNLARQIMEMRSAPGLSGKERPTVFAEIWSDPLMTAGAGSLINEAIALAGGKNIAGEINKEYFSVSAEWVVSRDPDIIICLDFTKTNDVSARTGWAGMKAVRNGRVYSGLDNNLILRAGPRVLDGVGVLRECISGKKTP